MREALSQERRQLIVNMAAETLFDESSESLEAREYVFTTRKISESVARNFRLGYVPKMAFSSGFAGRLILPLFDQHDELVCVTTRDWRPGANNRGHWHESFEKKWYLYGMSVALSAIKSTKKVLVVEGQFDVLRLHSIGITNCVGLLGSKPSWFQLGLLLREADEIILGLDSDEAGRHGTKEFFNLLKATGMSKMSQVKLNVVKLEGAKDLDEMVNIHGQDYVKELIGVSTE